LVGAFGEAFGCGVGRCQAPIQFGATKSIPRVAATITANFTFMLYMAPSISVASGLAANY
jgi:hypothetical protein